MTRCPDFAERTEIRRAIDAIIDTLEAIGEPVELISQYDLVDQTQGKSPSIDQTSAHVQEMSNRRVRQTYIDEVLELVDTYT